jgi:Tetratricopeptide repeat
MYKLVHAWGHDRLEVKQQQTWSLAALELLAEAVEKYQGSLVMEARLVLHVMADFTTMETACGPLYAFTHRDRSSVDVVGDFLGRIGRWAYEHAVRDFDVQITGQILGAKHPSTLASMNNLANVLSRQDKYEQTEEMHRQELAICQMVLGTEHPSTLTSMNNLATNLDCNKSC